MRHDEKPHPPAPTCQQWWEWQRCVRCAWFSTEAMFLNHRSPDVAFLLFPVSLNRNTHITHTLPQSGGKPEDTPETRLKNCYEELLHKDLCIIKTRLFSRAHPANTQVSTHPQRQSKASGGERGIQSSSEMFINSHVLPHTDKAPIRTDKLLFWRIIWQPIITRAAGERESEGGGGLVGLVVQPHSLPAFRFKGC